MFEYVDPEIGEPKKLSPQQFKPKTKTASSKLKGKIRVK
ncbi:unnamed protein product, partial [marine sediment metagenome]